MGLALLFGACWNAAAQEEKPVVSVVSHLLKQRGDSLYIDAEIRIAGDALKSTRSLELTPVLESSSRMIGLPSVLVLGKRSGKVYAREKALNNLKEEAPRYAVVDASKKSADGWTVPYKMTLPFEPWMKGASLVLAEDLCGCGKSEPAAPLTVANVSTPPDAYRMVPAFAYVEPVADVVKTAYIDFVVNRWDILPVYHNNAVELARIDSTMQELKNKNRAIRHISLKGYASPESPYPHNAFLAENRVKAMGEYLQKKYGYASDVYTLQFEPEDWAGFEARVLDDPEVPSREQVLAIITGGDDPDVKEAQLKALNGGVPFRYVLDKIFPFLRHTDYQIDLYAYTVDESRRVFKENPEKLSLKELFALARSYEEGGEAFNEVLDAAVRIYGSDPVANLNAANVAMGRGDYAKARSYLDAAGHSPSATHARGVLYMLEGNFEAAMPLLERAKAAGIGQASVNLSEMEKKKENIRQIESFTH